MSQLKYLVTGGAGFIGSSFVLESVLQKKIRVLNLDKLTYSGNLQSLASVAGDELYSFTRGGIGDREPLTRLLAEFQPDAIVNFAAESHVDRSIVDPDAFVRSNVLDLCVLLGVTLEWWKSLPRDRAANFRFLHISTDEVYGSLGIGDPAFTETTPYAPNSPYSASKASSDHFVRAFHETYGLPAIITNCSNNYGPRQFPEKLIPLVVLNALSGKALPVYGNGGNIRDWLHVEDHCAAAHLALNNGRIGQSYNIGGETELPNLDVVKRICAVLDKIRPDPQGPYSRLIRFVHDRAGHDFRYSINCAKAKRELGWTQKWNFDQGLAQTINWYLDNRDWLDNVQSGEYRRWMQTYYSNR